MWCVFVACKLCQLCKVGVALSLSHSLSPTPTTASGLAHDTSLGSASTSNARETSPSHHHALILECYRADPDGCRRFVLACKLYFSEYPEMTLAQKVTFLIPRNNLLLRLTHRKWYWGRCCHKCMGNPVDYILAPSTQES